MSFATYADGTVQTGIVLALGAGQYLAGAEIQRSTGDATGPFSTIGTLDDVSETGTAFIDLLPLDFKTRWYRVRHMEPGYTAGPWSGVVTAVPDILPNEDFSKKTFSPTNSTNLSLVMVPISETSTVLRVSSSVNWSPSGVAPTVSVGSYSGVLSVSFVSTGVYDIAKNVSGSGYVTFKTSLAGYVDDYDTVNAGNQSDALLPYLVMRSNVTAQSSTTLTVSCSYVNPFNTPGGTFSYVVQPVGAVSVTGTNPYTVVRPTGSGSALVIFTVTQAGFNSDSDPVVISPTPLPAIAIKSTQTGITGNTYTYSVVGVDPIPESDITFTMVGTNAAVSPATVTTASSAPFDITVVPTSLGTGRVTIKGTSPRRSDGQDAIDIGADFDNRAATVEFYTTQINSSGLPLLSLRAITGSTTRDVEVWVTEETSAPSATQSLDYSVYSRKGYQLPLSPFMRDDLNTEKVWVTSVVAHRAPSWLTVTLAPFDSNGKLGTATASLFIIPTVPPTNVNAFVSRSGVSSTGDTISTKVMTPASAVGTGIRVYRNGSPYGSDLTVIVGTNATQSITHTGLVPNTSYTWAYSAVSGSGESAKTTDLVMSTGAQTLLAPSASYTGRANQRIRFTIQNTTAYPAGTTFSGQYSYPGNPSFVDLVSVRDGELQSAELYSFSVHVSGTAQFKCSNSPNYTDSPYAPQVTWDYDPNS